MSQILVQKLGALLHLPLMLRSPNPSLQKTAMSLLNNMSRAGSVQTSMGEKKHAMSSVAGHECCSSWQVCDLLFASSSSPQPSRFCLSSRASSHLAPGKWAKVMTPLRQRVTQYGLWCWRTVRSARRPSVMNWWHRWLTSARMGEVLLFHHLVGVQLN